MSGIINVCLATIHGEQLSACGEQKEGNFSHESSGSLLLSVIFVSIIQYDFAAMVFMF